MRRALIKDYEKMYFKDKTYSDRVVQVQENMITITNSDTIIRKMLSQITMLAVAGQYVYMIYDTY